MTGSCHCGTVTVRLTHQPDYINDCNCSLCSNTGAIWGYYDPVDVIIEGETSSYTRKDYPEPAVRTHFCANCGCSTHWSPMPHIDQGRMGVNMRIFDPAELNGVELRYPDGRNWNGRQPFEYRRKPEIIGRGDVARD